MCHMAKKADFYFKILIVKILLSRGFSGGSVVKTPKFHHRNMCLIPVWGSSACHKVQPRKKSYIYIYIYTHTHIYIYIWRERGSEVHERIYFKIFSSVQSLSCVRLFVTPWTAACQASLSITNSRTLLKLMFIEMVMSNHSSSVIPFSS